jgi:hypothetical protein
MDARQLKRRYERHKAMVAWRAKFPWSNEEVVAALEEIVNATEGTWRLQCSAYHLRRAADFIRRTGRVTGWAMRQALPVLIRTCATCGAKATHRIGVEGRCRLHKDEAEARLIRMSVLYNSRAEDREQASRDDERERKRRDKLDGLRVTRRRRK